jgi:hypothetical protein
MNDLTSLFLATAILATGGLFLFINKSPNESDDNQTGGNDDEYFDEYYKGYNLFEPSEENDAESVESVEIIEPKSRAKRSGKTKRNKKSIGTKRRYY